MNETRSQIIGHNDETSSINMYLKTSLQKSYRHPSESYEVVQFLLMIVGATTSYVKLLCE